MVIQWKIKKEYRKIEIRLKLNIYGVILHISFQFDPYYQ